MWCETCILIEACFYSDKPETELAESEQDPAEDNGNI